jgi:hypothetical protein
MDQVATPDRPNSMALSRQRTRPVFLVGLSLLLLPIGGGAAAQGRRAGSELDRYLVTLGLNASDLRVAAQGDAAVKLLATQEGRDVAVVGVIGVRAPRAVAVARAIDDPAVIAAGTSRFGVFGDPPTAGDVRAVAFDRSEYRDLRGCRPTDCDFKLSAGEMAAFARDMDWSSPNAKAEEDERLRAGLIRLVADYRRHGNAAMPTYYDGATEVRASDAFAAIVAQAREMAAFAPDVLRYLTTYPAAPPNGARSYVYWSENRIGRMRPTLTVNHVVTYVPPVGTALLAKKQLYANHYLEGALELLAIVDAGVATGGSVQAPNVYVIVVRRFRFDNLPVGLFNVRGRVRNQLIERTRADLVRTRTAIEQPIASSGGGGSP